MRTLDEYNDLLSGIMGKVIAIVYNFRNEMAPGYKIYEAWKSDVISSWMIAIDELGAVPFILDARTFTSKIINGTMPHIDYVINLCNGLEDVSVLGVVPSICAFASLPCIPNNTKTIIIGEDKRVSNYLACCSGMKVPKEVSPTDSNGILRPISLGSSIGIKKTPCAIPQYDFICQEFVAGYDVTIPIIYNPLYEKFEVLSGVLYLPDEADNQWFLGEKEKLLHNQYEKISIKIPKDAQEILLRIADFFQIDTYCRIDTRLKISTILSRTDVSNLKFGIEDMFFLEINTMPTIKDGINFHTSIANLDDTYELYYAFKQYQSYIRNPSITGFILSTSILALDSKAKR